jgi:hypothetical protein
MIIHSLQTGNEANIVAAGHIRMGVSHEKRLHKPGKSSGGEVG